MSLTRTTRRSGLLLTFVGALGAAFYVATDPRWGVRYVDATLPWYDPRSWVRALRGSPLSAIDAANDAVVVTAVGVAGCALVLLAGIYLLTRRAV